MDEIYTTQNFNTFDPKKYFSEYHYYEEFDFNKHYTTEYFTENYGRGEHTYRYMLYTIRNIGSKFNDHNKKYVVAKEYLFDKERKQLAKYCPCPLHKNNKFIKGVGCNGCLVDGNTLVSQKTINRARRNSKTICNLF
jgi:hypothetical protein